MIERIVQDLNVFRQEIVSNSKLGLLNQNVHSENLMRNLLSIVYNIQLSNLNSGSSNFPGLDLGDFGNKVAFQITSTKTSAKVNHTLKTCLDNTLYDKFDTIKIFILSKKQRTYKINVITDQYFNFIPSNDILDFDDLFHEVKNLDLSRLKKIVALLEEELPYLVRSNSLDELSSNNETIPVLCIELNERFKIDFTDKEIEVYLKEAFHNLKLGLSHFHKIKLNQEGFFSDKLQILMESEKTLEVREEIVHVKEILGKLNSLKTELSDKVEMLFRIEKYPISDDYSNLTKCLKQIVEHLSFPYLLVEETTYTDYFPLMVPGEAQKFKGDFKFDVFKKQPNGKTLGCSIWLTKNEVLETKNKLGFYRNYPDETFLEEMLFVFQFETISFPVDTIVNKVIPSFISKFFDFKSSHYAFIDRDDNESWVDLTNYRVALA